MRLHAEFPERHRATREERHSQTTLDLAKLEVLHTSLGTTTKVGRPFFLDRRRRQHGSLRTEWSMLAKHYYLLFLLAESFRCQGRSK